MRIFAGLNQNQADDIVDELFGGIRSGKEHVGLLGMAFHKNNPASPNPFNGSDVYDVNGNLIWLLLGNLDDEEHLPCLKKLVKKLTQFAMLLGGFGKSWRRADHRIFYPKYDKHIIGCHWEWVEDNDSPVNNLDDATTLINETITAAKKWMLKRGFELKEPVIQKPTTKEITNTVKSKSSSSTANINANISPQNKKNQNNSQLPKIIRPVGRPVQQEKSQGNTTTQGKEWREAWYSDNVQVWGRIASKTEDSKVIHWLHSSRQNVSLKVKSDRFKTIKCPQSKIIWWKRI
ncbi:MAG: hypothetical protein AAF316_15500 [Cyanobacteria bacterium P01_A01_bin.80]